MTPQEMTELRNKRVMAALNIETPDRIPIFLSGQGYYKFIDPKATIADHFRRPEYMDDLLIQAAALPDLAEMDSRPTTSVSKAYMQAFAAMFFGKMKIPGEDLPDDMLWNVDEQGPMTEADYDTVIAKGWGYMTDELNKRIGYDPAAIPPPDKEYLDQLQQRIAPLGKTTIAATSFPPFAPFEVLSGARRLNNFFRDLRRIPDKVRAAIEVIEDYSVEQTIKALKTTPPSPFAFIGGSRSGSTFISPQVFERFYFPYFQKLIPEMEKINVKTWLHMDNDWSGFLHYFKEFSKGQCIWDPDQMTPILKIKEVLGDKMCITGNLSPALLSVGTPDQVYASTKQICSEMGKTGFIMTSGCSVPIDAKRENVAAAIAAALDS
jgi:uroporphyrinogen-III decarboxylase